jgi:hypothetical protein
MRAKMEGDVNDISATLNKPAQRHVVYQLTTEMRASFVNLDDARFYCDRLRNEEPDASIYEPRRNPATNHYVVIFFKTEEIHEGAPHVARS